MANSVTKFNGKAFELFLIAVALSLKVSTAVAVATPVVVWDGDAVGYTFDIRSRAVGNVAYTMAINPENASVSSANDCIAIGDENQKWTVKITADSVGAFGNTANGFTVIAKVSNAGTSANSNRALLNYFTGDHHAAVAFAQAPDGRAFPMLNEEAWSGYATDAWTLSADGKVQTLALAYDTAEGVRLMVDGVVKWENPTYAPFAGTPEGLTIGGVPNDGSGKLFAMSGLKIYAVAVFTNKLSDAEVAEYAFPSEEQHIEVAANTTVSAINAKTSASTKNLYLHVADGVTITGDAPFTTARNVHFICNGDFILTPPAGNTATFDFSGVTGKPVIEYASLPTVSGSVFTPTTVPTFVTDSAKWSGVIYISGGSFTNFTSNAFGNELSVVRLGTVSGWLRAPGNYAFTNSVPVELVGTLTINNGNSANNSYPNRCTAFKKLSGSGKISTDSTANKVVVVIQDASEFTGDIAMSNGKLIVFGDAMPSYDANNTFEGMVGSIWVMEGARVTVNGFWWATGGMKVYGELRAANLNKFGGGTYIEMPDTGKLTLSDASNANDSSIDFGRIRGSGILRLESESSWRAIPLANFPTNSILENELGGGLLLMASGQAYTIGSLSGSKKIRTDWDPGNRDLRILQAKDTTYSGNFDSAIDRLGTVTVAPGVSASGTLTLSGIQTADNNLVVEPGAKVNLTGTWKGPVTVNGSISGTGTIDGDLTLGDCATIDIDLGSPLDVRGKIIEGDGVTINPRRASLNGTSQSLEETLRLMGLFGGDALAGDGVTFKFGGIDMSDGTIRLDVTPAVAAGNSLSVFGKADLGDRWRRLKVNPEGSYVSIFDGDLAECRFFQIRAEIGEKTAGYAVTERLATGDSENTKTKSYFTSSTVGGETVLFSILLDGGCDSDYRANCYKSLSFNLRGVAAGVTATLATNGVVATSSKVGDDGYVAFGDMPLLGNDVTVSLGISTSAADGKKISTASLDETAGVLSYGWGDSVANTVDDGVTNVCTLLAKSPYYDGLGNDAKGVFRIPAIAKATNNLVIAIYDCRYKSGADLGSLDESKEYRWPINIAGNISVDGGLTWSRPSLQGEIPVSYDFASETFTDIGKDVNFGDPCILYDPAFHKFWMMGITGGGISSHHSGSTALSDVVLYSRGGEAGDAWGNRRSIKGEVLAALANVDSSLHTDESDPNLIGILQGPGHGIVQQRNATNALGEVIMPKGALVFPMQYFYSSFYESHCFAIYSTDNGQTWQATKLTPSSGLGGMECYAQEGCVVELDDGSWVQMAKNGKADIDATTYRHFFRTTDFTNWTHCATIHPSCRCQGSCLRIGAAATDGKSRYVACFAARGDYYNGRRGMLTLHFGRDVSEDPNGPGIEWDGEKVLIWPEMMGGYAYNSLVMLDDHTLGILFETEYGGHIYLRKVDLNHFLNLSE